MKIVAVCLARNEAEIIGQTIDQLYRNGVDEVWVEDGYSSDDTVDVCVLHGAQILHAVDREFHQSDQISALARWAAKPGDWVIPFDADEFWYANNGTIKEALTVTDATVCQARMFLHRDLDHRRAEPKPLSKVAFRYQPGSKIQDGNHGVDNAMPGPVRWGVLDLREWQYRSFEHLLQKVERDREARQITSLPDSYGSHMVRLDRMTDEELEAEWVRMNKGEWVFDPIP